MMCRLGAFQGVTKIDVSKSDKMYRYGDFFLKSNLFYYVLRFGRDTPQQQESPKTPYY